MRVTPETSKNEDGRTRRRFAAMRRLQEVALDLFEDRGFGSVTIEEIAAAADLGPATVYRNFGTKERIVLWDDYDPALFAQIADRLPGPPLAAMLEGVIAALAPIYKRDHVRLLRRTRLALSIPSVVAASAADMMALRTGLSRLLVEQGGIKSALDADVLAATFAATLEVALAHWVAGKGATPLATVLRRAFAVPQRFSPKRQSS